jgi:DMSO/TMAO reductase YedYZ molybdopterin-dependent catalytic subunit
MPRVIKPADVDARRAVQAAAKLVPDPTRRLLLRGAASLGALSFLTGCDVTGGNALDKALRAISRFNDGAQALLFDPNRLAPTYPESAIARPFRFNGYYDEEDAPEIDPDDYKLAVGGLVENKKAWSLEELYALPQETQITRLICVEGWSLIGKWTGTPLRHFLARIGADTTAKYVYFRCADRYFTSIDMPTAVHPQTQMTVRFDGAILPRSFGFPLRIRIPTKLGFKNPKYVVELAVTNEYLGGYWENQGYNWFSGL